MKIISVISQKGGAGKTTLAVHLAVAAIQDKKKVVLIDLDPQASSACWGDLRNMDSPAVVSAQASRLTQIIDAARSMEADLCIIDTAPHSESSALAAARASDLMVIPCRPALFDLQAIGNSVELSKLASSKAVVVLNSVPSRGALANEAEEGILNKYKIDVCPIKIVQRADYVHSITIGKTVQEYDPKGKAANEIKNLYKWICKSMK